MAKIENVVHPESGLLLHSVIHGELGIPISDLERIDFSDPDEFLQGAVIRIPENFSFRPHVHLERSRRFENLRAQETWVVMRGTVEVDYFTDENSFIKTVELQAGDISITFRGGHGYRTKSSDALVYEFKSGPYEGVEVDKRFI